MTPRPEGLYDEPFIGYSKGDINQAWAKPLTMQDKQVLFHAEYLCACLQLVIQWEGC